jgi:two-component system, NarL family, sensor histidine kinase DesK
MPDFWGRRSLDPTGMFLPGARPVTRADWRRKRISINFSFLFLLFPLSALAGSHPPAWRVAVVAAGVVVFIGVYNWLPRRNPVPVPEPLLWPALFVLAGTTVALALADRATWTLLFVFTAVAGAMRLPRPMYVVWIAFCVALCAVTNIAVGSSTGTTISLSATTLAIGVMMVSFRQLIDVNNDLIAAREEVARLAVSEERLRFARDLHDILGHSLSVIAVKAELAEHLLRTDVDAASEHVTELKTVARTALGEVREAVSGYRRPTLVSEMAGARMALEAAGIEADLQSSDVVLPPEVEAVLAWAIREGTTNTIRHSGAQHCRIVVAPASDAARAEVVDDGAADCPEPAGNGLAGLRERVELLAGRLEAGPLDGGGFRLAVSVPLAGAPT